MGQVADQVTASRKDRYMRNILLASAALALMAAPAMAQTVTSPTYYGTLGYSQMDADGADVGAVTGRFGAKFTPNLGAEAEASFGVGSDTFRVGASEIKVEENYDVAVYGVATLPVNANFDLFARAGFGTTELKASATFAASRFQKPDIKKARSVRGAPFFVAVRPVSGRARCQGPSHRALSERLEEQIAIAFKHFDDHHGQVLGDDLAPLALHRRDAVHDHRLMGRPAHASEHGGNILGEGFQPGFPGIGGLGHADCSPFFTPQTPRKISPLVQASARIRDRGESRT